MAGRRRKRRSGPRRRRGNWLWRIVGVGAAVVAVLAIGAYLALRAYLRSDEFRTFLAGKAGEALKSKAEFAPFQWDGLQVSSSKFEARGGPYFTYLRADQLRTEVGLGEVTRGRWLLRGTSIRRLEVEIPGTPTPAPESAESSAETAPSPPSARPEPERTGWLPKSARIEDLRIDESIITGHLGEHRFAARGQSWTVRPGDGPDTFEIEAQGGTLEHPLRWFPDARLRKARFRTSGARIYLLDAEFNVYRNALLDLSGEAAFNSKNFTFDGGATEIGCEEVLPEDWTKRLLGKIGTRFTVSGKDGKTTVTGQLGLRDGVLTALPVLDRLAAYADTARFRTLPLNRARTDFSWDGERLSLTKILISSEGLMRLEGRLDVTGEQLDGFFRLGLAPGTLARIPGAESVVFAERHDGLMWTPLHITGTIDNPEEDLSARLIKAAGDRMFEIIPETGAKVLKFTRDVIDDAPAQAVKTGTEAIETGVGVIRDATGIARGIGGIFGILPKTETPPPSPENPENSTKSE